MKKTNIEIAVEALTELSQCDGSPQNVKDAEVLAHRVRALAKSTLAALQAAPAPKLTYEQCAQIGRDFGLQPETVDMVGRRVLALFPVLDTSTPAQGSIDTPDDRAAFEAWASARHQGYFAFPILSPSQIEEKVKRRCLDAWLAARSLAQRAASADEETPHCKLGGGCMCITEPGNIVSESCKFYEAPKASAPDAPAGEVDDIAHAIAAKVVKLDARTHSGIFTIAQVILKIRAARAAVAPAGHAEPVAWIAVETLPHKQTMVVATDFDTYALAYQRYDLGETVWYSADGPEDIEMQLTFSPTHWMAIPPRASIAAPVAAEPARALPPCVTAHHFDQVKAAQLPCLADDAHEKLMATVDAQIAELARRIKIKNDRRVSNVAVEVDRRMASQDRRATQRGVK
jgi:hypothetical protein